MTPLPKQRLSHGRTRRRRAHHRLKLRKLVVCHNCDELKIAHHICLNCGHYAGREIFEVKQEE